MTAAVGVFTHDRAEIPPLPAEAAGANQASLDLQHTYGVDPHDNGLERFITATRRQNFLIPPRRHRAFPFAEFGGNPGHARR